MQIDVTFRRMEASDAIKTYLDEKMTKMKKFLASPAHAHVVLTSERFRNKADVTVTLKNGLLIKGVDTSEDMYFSIDQAVSRIEKQLRKYKEKIQHHKPSTSPAIRFKSHVIESINPDDEFKVSKYDYDEEDPGGPRSAESSMGEEVEEGMVAKDLEHQIVRSTEYLAEPMDLDAALMQIELQDRKFLVFTNSETNTINVLYYREDGKYGLIETGKR